MTRMHLDQISEYVQPEYHAILSMDRTGWHITEALNIPEDLTLMPLPPYLPELNPMGQVWQQPEKIKSANTDFKDYDNIVDSCCEARNCFCDEDGNIQSLCARDWGEDIGTYFLGLVLFMCRVPAWSGKNI